MRAVSTPIAASASSSSISLAQRDDGPGADVKLGARDERARRHDAQRELTVPDLDRVPGVVPAAEARDDRIVPGEQVDDAALALVAPLNAEDDIDARRRAGARPAAGARYYSPRKSRSAVEPTGSGGTPSNVVMMYSLKSAFGQPKSTREYLRRIVRIERFVQEMVAGIGVEEFVEHVCRSLSVVAVKPCIRIASGHTQPSLVCGEPIPRASLPL